MQTSYISFCDKYALNIKSNHIKQSILDRLQTYDVKIIGKHHDTYSENNMHRLQRVPHLLMVRTNGNPYYLYFTRLNFVNTVLFIDKKVQMGYSLPRIIITRLTINNDDLFNGTLFDGEMIKTVHGKWLFLMSDLIVWNNHGLQDEDYVKRLNRMYAVLEKSFIPTHMDLFNIQVKRTFECKDVQNLIDDFIPKLPYSIRGIYCKPLYLKFKDILYNFDASLIKNVEKKTFKHISHFIASPHTINASSSRAATSFTIDQTVDLTIDVDDPHLVSNYGNQEENERVLHVQKTDTPDLYRLYNNNEYVGDACIDTLHTSKLMRNALISHSLTVKTKFRCRKSTNDNFQNKWIPFELMDIKNR